MKLLDCTNNMDEEVIEKVLDESLDIDEAEKLQEIVDDTGLDVDDAEELRQEL